MFEKLKYILTTNFQWFNLNNEVIVNHAKLKDDLKLDSISLVNLQILIEDEFDIRFNPLEDDIAEIFYDIDSLVSFIERKVDA